MKNRDTILYKLHSGKPSKLLFFISGYIRLLIPSSYYRHRLPNILNNAKRRNDYDEILRRVNYYIKPQSPFALPSSDESVRGLTWLRYRGRFDGIKRNTFHTAYFFDQRDFTRYFPSSLRWQYCPGDVYFTPSSPTVVKSRLLTDGNANSVLLKLDKLRHFMFVNDPVPFARKRDAVIFRGKIRQSRLRTTFLRKFFGKAGFDCGVVGRNEGCPEEWMQPKKTIREHLDYKYIMAIEGNDVASNLKWVMSSNSIAVMPRPTCETWFMEGQLRGGYHYIEVADDFSDLEDKLRYYSSHPAEAEAIVRHAHEWVAQFRDAERERIIGLLVLDRYLQLSGQK